MDENNQETVPENISEGDNTGDNANSVERECEELIEDTRPLRSSEKRRRYYMEMSKFDM